MTSIDDAPQRSAAHDAVAEVLRGHIRDIPDWPQPGVVFKDITPLLATPTAFGVVIGALADAARALGATTIAGIEARGFLLAAPVADRLGTGLVPIRKQGKLPGPTRSASYDLEYGAATIEIHADAVHDGDRVLLVDDVLATGGTAAAAHSLLAAGGGEVVGLAVLMELSFLPGRDRVAPLDVVSLLTI
ncbi:adenine phosphoribosyltransferase [Frankia sp. CcI156]|uniref:Adenine phosphoribosyltransferase n=1 Tax=Frankia casuarinae (strain DSM 45818 / CECT 9043 / HFP020203 / CcI3) TaxID=106370 RepID=APT_FRACC|nr:MULTISPECIES: adenine phosphoribosyltransferase [Frankia]Q2JD90.1 RecName: Full=Adenine phosphoribosyltransferase; Short=APRT [Frankia casuarinae]ABD10752.1 adenine phosphoribosyltransferase [Frankia casuarinae]ETA02099.1 adenine phosphoribosyltransferase [Frankia sp. CcI6]EYT93306.1 adenine phosphoribosyltransferase [Frankia casuarinae]KDA43981.1 adenine phosphoribosyltransferase [Frankia sp. BMG5.23]KEZ37685.1 adenine phosphoribosyltransferase [Frankia sp. CeD]